MVFTTVQSYRDLFTPKNIKPNAKVYIDMSCVFFVDTTGISCLTDWVSQIKTKRATVAFIGVSNHVAKIFKICELDFLIDSQFCPNTHQHTLSFIYNRVQLHH
ncbi:STAS domain-containing protein [Aneurinibacillus soli]